MKKFHVFQIAIISCLFFFCSGVVIYAKDAMKEEKAIDKLSSDIFDIKDKLSGMKIGVFDFTTLDGKEIPDGKRLADRLLEKLIKKGKLIFIERAQLDKLLKAQGIEQTGVIDPNEVRESGKVLPIDVMIHGTLARVGSQAELSIRVVNISSGEIYLASSVALKPNETLALKENPELLKISREDPYKIDNINRSYITLLKWSKNKPLIFLIVVLNEDEISVLERDRPKMADALKKRKERIETRRPKFNQNLVRMKKGFELIKQHDPERYGMLMQKKTELLNSKKISNDSD